MMKEEEKTAADGKQRVGVRNSTEQLRAKKAPRLSSLPLQSSSHTHAGHRTKPSGISHWLAGGDPRWRWASASARAVSCIPALFVVGPYILRCRVAKREPLSHLGALGSVLRRRTVALACRNIVGYRVVRPLVKGEPAGSCGSVMWGCRMHKLKLVYQPEGSPSNCPARKKKEQDSSVDSWCRFWW